MQQFRYVISVLLLCLFSCEMSSSDSSILNIDNTNTVETKLTDSSNAIAVIDTNDQFESYPLGNGPKETYPLTIVSEGMIHGAEFPFDFEEKLWHGIFRTDSSKGILKVVNPIKTIRFDAVVDEDTLAPSGVNISVAHDSNEALIILFSGLDTLYDDSLVFANVGPTEIMVGEVRRFNFNGKQYELSAIGQQADDNQGWNGTSHYQLYLSELVNKIPIKKSLINASLFIDDAAIQVLFMGDIDQDGKLDIVMEAAHKYSYSAPVIFLSSLANENETVKLAGLSIFTSC